MGHSVVRRAIPNNEIKLDRYATPSKCRMIGPMEIANEIVVCRNYHISARDRIDLFGFANSCG